jgi:magnesium-transporting ATPase (P-type)
MWANTVVATGTVIGVVIYTGIETRSVMNANLPVQKVGKMDAELNTFSKVSLVATMILIMIHNCDYVCVIDVICNHINNGIYSHSIERIRWLFLYLFLSFHSFILIHHPD